MTFFLYMKMGNKYHQKHKEKLWKEARERYQSLSVEEKDKRRRKTRNRHQNLSEEKEERKCQYHWERNKNLSEEKKAKASWVCENLLFST